MIKHFNFKIKFNATEVELSFLEKYKDRPDIIAKVFELLLKDLALKNAIPMPNVLKVIGEKVER